MAQHSKQIHTQAQQQLQTLSARQVLVARLLQLPAVELEERVRAELLENPALEEEDTSQTLPEEQAENEWTTPEEENDYDERADYLTPDDIPDYKLQEPNYRSTEHSSIPLSVEPSFYDQLKNQLAEQPMDQRTRQIAAYLIASLDDIGYLRPTLQAMADELLLYSNINATQAELEEALRMIQTFDPPGVGARNLQECLLIQIERRMKKEGADTHLLAIEKEIVTKYYEDFAHKNWEKMAQRIGTSDQECRRAIEEICRLNPRPGAAMGEVMGRNIWQIVPDFVVETHDDGDVTVNLNNPQLPTLRISPHYARMYEQQAKATGRKKKETTQAQMFLQMKMEAARNFIEALQTRQTTLMDCMKTIVEWQQPFFKEGDEALLQPMLMKDVAEKIGVDVSTVSRVASSKYVQTNYGIYPLKFFFNDTYTNPEGEEVSISRIRTAMTECVAEEDKQKPYTDDELCERMKQKGLPIARRTVAKYRKQLGIPTARMRRKAL